MLLDDDEDDDDIVEQLLLIALKLAVDMVDMLLALVDVFIFVDELLVLGITLNEKNLSFSPVSRHNMPKRSVSSLFCKMSHTFVTLFSENKATCL